MPWHLAANGLGVAVAAVWVGWTLSTGHVGWAAIASVPVFLAGMLHPFLAEYGALGRGFQRLDDERRDRRMRERGEGPREEIFLGGGAPEPKPMFRRRVNPNLPAILLFVVATALLAGDVAWFAVDRVEQPPAQSNGVISNY